MMKTIVTGVCDMTATRDAYRTTPDELDHLSVALPTAEGQPVQGRIISLNFFGVSIGFPRDALSPIPLGLEQTITFSSPQLKKPIDVKVRAQSRVDEDGIHRYDFDYVNQDELKSQLPAPLFRLFNQRKAYRVAPDEKAPISVTVKACDGDEREVVCRLVDISGTGIALMLDQAGEVALAATDKVALSFNLPNRPRAFRLEAWIRHRRVVGQEIRVGLEFVDGEQETIVDYVMVRQREEMQLTV